MRIVMTFAIVLMTIFSVSAQLSPVGVWKTIDDETGEAKSHVEIYEQDGKFYGKVVKLLLKPADTKCEKCSGKRKNQPVVGMVIIEDLEPYRYYWAEGTILDPASGKEYGCSVWFEDDDNSKLYLRGKHWTGLFRDQTWHRIK